MHRAHKYTNFFEVVNSLFYAFCTIHAAYDGFSRSYVAAEHWWTLKVQTNTKGPCKLCGEMQQIKFLYSHMIKLPHIMLKHMLNIFVF